MTFTIKCDKCGNEQSFKQGDKARNTDIDLEIYMSRDYQSYPIEITIFCENHECNNMVDLKY